jgi:hypothetical protein
MPFFSPARNLHRLRHARDPRARPAKSRPDGTCRRWSSMRAIGLNCAIRIAGEVFRAVWLMCRPLSSEPFARRNWHRHFQPILYRRVDLLSAWLRLQQGAATAWRRMSRERIGNSGMYSATWNRALFRFRYGPDMFPPVSPGWPRCRSKLSRMRKRPRPVAGRRRTTWAGAHLR